MLRRTHRITRLAARLLACAALLAAAPAAAQQEWLEAPRLLNEAEIDQRILAGYPAAQRDSGVPGFAHLWLRVLEDGTVEPGSASVRDASDPAFGELAQGLAPGMRFAPARMAGQAVPVWIRHQVLFDPQRAPAARVGGPVPPDEGTYDLSAVEVLPGIRNRADAARQIARRYPAELRDAGISGGVVLRFRITEEGRVDPATPEVELTTDPRFDEAALGVIQVMRFQPAMINDRPVRVWISIPIQFALPEAGPADSTRTAPAPR